MTCDEVEVPSGEKAPGTCSPARVSSNEVDGALGERVECAPAPQEVSVQERIARLFAQMPARRGVLLGILDWCRTAQLVEAVNARVEELQAHNRSVYTPATLCSLLEQAGALAHVDETGTPIDPEARTPREVVAEDGTTYLEVEHQGPTFWRSTEAGVAAVERDDPQARLAVLLAEEPQYLPIYQRVLELCSCEGGASAGKLGTVIDSDPLVQSPRRFAMYFLDRLELGGAVAWEGAWTTTELGREVLTQMKAVDAQAAGDAAGEGE